VEAFNSACNSRKYRSGLRSSRLRMASRSTRGFGPGRYKLRSVDPVRRLALDIFQAHGTLTPNRSANSASVPLPLSWASNNFLRRSSEYGRAISSASTRNPSLQRIKLYTIG
jgi:hypothetical protein